jgi:hypothetical protein
MTRHKIVVVGLLLLAVLPILVVAVMAVRIWVFGAPLELWRAPAWGLYLLQVAALFGFALHILGNKHFQGGQSGHWLLELVLYHQVTMLKYWVQHVWHEPRKLRA